jgi:hypothetical protein
LVCFIQFNLGAVFCSGSYTVTRKLSVSLCVFTGAYTLQIPSNTV